MPLCRRGPDYQGRSSIYGMYRHVTCTGKQKCMYATSTMCTQQSRSVDSGLQAVLVQACVSRTVAQHHESQNSTGPADQKFMPAACKRVQPNDGKDKGSLQSSHFYGGSMSCHWSRQNGCATGHTLMRSQHDVYRSIHLPAHHTDVAHRCTWALHWLPTWVVQCTPSCSSPATCL